MSRNRVVLPEPEGPSSAISSPARTDRLTPPTAVASPNRLLRSTALMSVPAFQSMGRPSRDGMAIPPLEDGLCRQSEEGDASQERGDRKSGHEVVFIVEDLDVKRHGGGQATDMARDDGDGAELAHRAGIAQENAVEQRPADVGQGDGKKRTQARRS